MISARARSDSKRRRRRRGEWQAPVLRIEGGSVTVDPAYAVQLRTQLVTSACFEDPSANTSVVEWAISPPVPVGPQGRAGAVRAVF
jgi:hypothetical protein